MSIIGFLETILFLLTSFFKAFCRTCLPSYMQSRKRLNGQVVLITGAGSGIGRELAKTFAQKEANLVLWDLSTDSNEDTAKVCRNISGKEVYTQTVDVSSREAIYTAAKQIEVVSNGKIKLDDVDIVVNNAGIRNSCELYQEASDESIEKVIRVNLMQLLWTTKVFLPHMIARNSGHIVAISSVGAFIGLPTALDYTASKFGVFGFMEGIQSDLHWQNPKSNIQFTTICPHFVATPLIHQSTLSEEFPHLTPEEVAICVVDGVERNQRVVFIPSAPLTVLYALKGNERAEIAPDFAYREFFDIFRDENSFSAYQVVQKADIEFGNQLAGRSFKVPIVITRDDGKVINKWVLVSTVRREVAAISPLGLSDVTLFVLVMALIVFFLIMILMFIMYRRRKDFNDIEKNGNLVNGNFAGTTKEALADNGNEKEKNMLLDIPYWLPEINEIGPYDETRVFQHEGSGSILSLDEQNTTIESTEV